MIDLPPPPAPLPRTVVDNHCHLDIARDGEALPVDEAIASAARSPGATSVTSLPTLSTVPYASLPRTIGVSDL